MSLGIRDSQNPANGPKSHRLQLSGWNPSDISDSAIIRLRRLARLPRITPKRRLLSRPTFSMRWASDPATSYNPSTRRTATCSDRGASTARASERCERTFQPASRRSTSAHSASSPMIRLCGTDSPATRDLPRKSLCVRTWRIRCFRLNSKNPFIRSGEHARLAILRKVLP